MPIAHKPSTPFHTTNDTNNTTININNTTTNTNMTMTIEIISTKRP